MWPKYSLQRGYSTGSPGQLLKKAVTSKLTNVPPVASSGRHKTLRHMTNTRQIDLDYLDQKLSNRQTEIGKKRTKANLISTYLQSKDPILEKMRQKLITCVKMLHDPNVQANLVAHKQWQENYVKLNNVIVQYVAQPSVAGKIAAEVEKAAGYIEAERIFNRLTGKGGENK